MPRRLRDRLLQIKLFTSRNGDQLSAEMTPAGDDLLRQIALSRPANEAEVETKILLHLLRLLGYSDADRADKVKVRMRFGRKVLEKVADFILYNGAERSLPNALLTVEAKRIGEALAGAEEQARSYAAWAGTPFILVCNGVEILVAQVIPGSGHVSATIVAVRDLPERFDQIREIVSRAETVLAKERISYVSMYLPEVERLPPAEFFREYLTRLHERFQNLKFDVGPLNPPMRGEFVQLQIPVNVRRVGAGNDDLGVIELSDLLLLPDALLFVDGAPGTGKSTLCRRIASELAERALNDVNAAHVPIYLDLGRGVPVSLPAAFHRACEDVGVRVFPELYKRSLARGKVILLLDGLDELLTAGGRDAEIDVLLNEGRITAALLTSRPGWRESTDLRADRRRFHHFRVRHLNDAELDAVIRSHLIDTSKATALLRSADEGRIPDLRSAMTALMAIRVANDTPDWDSLSIFELYCRYVEALHRFFNAPTVRGREGAIPAASEQILNALASAALICRESESAGYGVSLGDLIHALRATHGVDADALLNCGLLTSDAGRAGFVHRTFEDFGLAYRLVSDFRVRGCAGLHLRHITDDAYRIAASALGPADEEQLAGCLFHHDKHVRKRAIGLLSRMPCSNSTVGALWHQLSLEPSVKVWSTIARTLFRVRAPGFTTWLQNAVARLSPRQLSSVFWAIRRSRDVSLLAITLDAFELKPTKHVGLAAFDLGVDVDGPNITDALVSVYMRLDQLSRSAVSRLLRQRSGPQRELVIRRILKWERSARPLVELLSITETHSFKVDDESTYAIAVTIATAVLPDNFRAKKRRRLLELAKRLRTLPDATDAMRQLADACEKKGTIADDRVSPE